MVKLTDDPSTGARNLYSGVHRVVGPPGRQASHPRHSVVYFSRPNGDVRLGSLFATDEERQKEPTADEWIARRARLRSTANFKGEETLRMARGTEHHVADRQERSGSGDGKTIVGDVEKGWRVDGLDKPRTAVETM